MIKSLKNISLFLCACALILNSCKPEKPGLLLPVLGAKKLSGKDTVYHTVGQFSFLNQYGEIVTDKSVENKIYVADFFFTTCQSICPEMSSNLKEIQKHFENNDSVLILSHSVNPRHDTVEVLYNYAGAYGAKKGKWHLLTGDKKAIYDLARTGYLVNAIEDDGSAEGFLHSELFLLVDSKGRIRGMYDGTDKAAVIQLIDHLKLLMQEKSN
jgi:protein SCO1